MRVENPEEKVSSRFSVCARAEAAGAGAGAGSPTPGNHGNHGACVSCCRIRTPAKNGFGFPFEATNVGYPQNRHTHKDMVATWVPNQCLDITMVIRGLTAHGDLRGARCLKCCFPAWGREPRKGSSKRNLEARKLWRRELAGFVGATRVGMVNPAGMDHPCCGWKMSCITKGTMVETVTFGGIYVGESDDSVGFLKGAKWTSHPSTAETNIGGSWSLRGGHPLGYDDCKTGTLWTSEFGDGFLSTNHWELGCPRLKRRACAPDARVV